MHLQFHPLSWDFSMARNMQVIIGGSTVHSIRLLIIYHPNVEKSASIQFTQKRHAIVCTHKEKHNKKQVDSFLLDDHLSFFLSITGFSTFLDLGSFSNDR